MLFYRSPLGETARRRLQAMRQYNSGFKLAEIDLKLRGPGEVLGTRQTGSVGLRIADVTRDEARLPVVRELAARFLQEYPERVAALIQRWLGNKLDYGQV